jgi:hypothetical protein
MTLRWTLSLVGAAGLGGFALGLWRGHEPPQEVTRAESHESDKKATVETKTAYVDRAGPVVTRWRKAPAAPGCPAIDEVVQEKGPTERVIQEAVKIATEERTRDVRVETVRVVRPDYRVGALLLLGMPHLHSPGMDWQVGVELSRRLVGGIDVAATVLGGPGGTRVGIGLGVSF